MTTIQPTGPEGIFNVIPLSRAEQLQPAMICAFQYLYYKKDPQPLVLVLDVVEQAGHKLMRGVNLHYLPAPVTRQVVNYYCKNPAGWNWDSAIKGRAGMEGAFRSYVMTGMMNPRGIDWRGFLTQLSIMRDMNPVERQRFVAIAEKQLFDRRVEPGRVQAMLQAQLQRMSRIVTAPAGPASAQITRGSAAAAPPSSAVDAPDGGETTTGGAA